MWQSNFYFNNFFKHCIPGVKGINNVTERNLQHGDKWENDNKQPGVCHIMPISFFKYKNVSCGEPLEKIQQMINNSKVT